MTGVGEGIATPVIASPEGAWRSPLRGAKPRGNLHPKGDRFAALAMTV